MIGPDVRTKLPHVAGGFVATAADPPWRFDDQGSRAAPTYDTMSLHEICEMPISSIAAPRAYLFLWCPSALIFPCVEEVMHAWGFRYTGASIVWIKIAENGKPRIGMGHHVRNAHEICFIGERGGLTARNRGIPSWIAAPRDAHSAKPPIFAEVFSMLAPEGPRLELFARETKPGWLCWGNEIEERAAWEAFRVPMEVRP